MYIKQIFLKSFFAKWLVKILHKIFFGPNVANTFQNLKIKLGLFFRKKEKIATLNSLFNVFGSKSGECFAIKNIGNNSPKKEEYCHIIFPFYCFWSKCG